MPSPGGEGSFFARSIISRAKKSVEANHSIIPCSGHIINSNGFFAGCTRRVHLSPRRSYGIIIRYSILSILRPQQCFSAAILYCGRKTPASSLRRSLNPSPWRSQRYRTPEIRIRLQVLIDHFVSARSAAAGAEPPALRLYCPAPPDASHARKARVYRVPRMRHISHTASAEYIARERQALRVCSASVYRFHADAVCNSCGGTPQSMREAQFISSFLH